MKKTKKKLLILISTFAFAILMMVNVSVSADNTNANSCLSLTGMKAMAVSAQEGSCTCADYRNWLGNCSGATTRVCEGGAGCEDVCGS